MQFTWNEEKAQTNLKKHDISFNEAQTVFDDEEAILIADPEHSEVEDRFILLGMSKYLNILVVCHCYREEDNIIRIISARHATKNEEKTYTRRKN